MAREVELRERLRAVEDRIGRACSEAGRDRADVTLVAVTKFFPASDVEILAGLGATDIGESRDQEAGAKIEGLPQAVRDRIRVHFVGQLQTNKARRVARYADVVQSVDRLRLVRALDAGRAAAQQEGAASGLLDVLLQVDLGRDSAVRGGVADEPAAIDELADAVAAAAALRLRGVMAIAPLGLDQAAVRRAFDRLRALGEGLRHTHPCADWVSAGMSGDLETAVAAGATHLRVGTAILGSRPSPR